MENIGKLLSKLSPPRFKHHVWDTKINYFQINTLCNNLKLINVLLIITISILTYGQQNSNPILKNIDLTLQDMYEGQTNIYKTINKMDAKLNRIQVVQKSMSTLMKTISGLVGSIEGTVSSLEVIVGLIKLDTAAIKTSSSITSNLLVDQIPIISGNLEAIKVIQNEMQIDLDIVSGDTTAIESELLALNTILTAVAADTTGILAETTTIVASNAELATASTASLALFTAFSEDYFNPATISTLGFFKVHLTSVDTKDSLQVQVEQWNTDDVVNVKEKDQLNVKVVNDINISNFPSSFEITNFPDYPEILDVNIKSSEISIPVEIGSNLTINFPEQFDVNVDNFPVDYKVSNFPDSYKINNFPEWISIANFPDKLETINIGNFPNKWDVRIIDATIDIPVSVRFLPDVTIANFPADYKVNNFPDSYKVNNFPEWISIANFPDKLETINIGNFPYKWDVRIIDATIDVPVMIQHSIDINIGNYPELPTVFPVIQTREISIQEPVHVTLEGGFVDGYMVVEVLPHPSVSCCNTQFYKILTELATIIDIKENNCLDMYLEPLDFTTNVKIPFLLCNGVSLTCDMSYQGWTILGINYDQVCEPYIVSNPGNFKVGTGHIDMEAAIEFGYTSNHLFLACEGLDGNECDKYKT